APGRIKVGDFFTNNKVSRGRRDAAKVLVDAKGIVWLMGHRLAHRVRVTAGTKRLLHVRL
ncbi:MAG: tRNA(Ile)-lysidine synthetase, partial [Phycisphaerae bacterium]|nr:tRNA(Ile)-lysidine synthetase [Phycisphaerae bacterium]